jgi:ABC-type transport system involved in multi-copper enzyme maturation permease subunit
MRQTLAIFLDAYRELNSRKLFWIVMLLSGGVVAIFGAVGINESGLTLLWFDLPSSIFNSRLFSEALFYKTLFTNLGVKFWLAWASTILALIATAGIIPDLISSGSVELTLSRPISRLRLFLTKYAAGLLFTAVQVTVFTVASFLVLGLRAGVWEPGVFWTIPLMVLFFSYLFAICVLLGLLTRSTVASLLLTILLWFCIFLMHTGERSGLALREVNAAQRSSAEAEISRLTKTVDGFRAQYGAEAPLPTYAAGMPDRIANRRARLAKLEESAATIRTWHSITLGVKTVLPKTTETLELLERVLVSEADMEQLRSDDDGDMVLADGPDEIPVSGSKVAERVQDAVRSRPVWWVVGTSVAFQAVVLAIAGWIFCRRDF